MDALRTCLLWLDADPLRYSVAAWIIFGATAALAFLAEARTPEPGAPPAGRPRTWLFLGCVALTLAAFRWPSWFVPGQLNPDEAQMLAGAITLQRFPVYWKFVDGTTHGPLCEYLLLAPAWLGAPLNYVTARVVAAVLLALSLAGAWGTLRCFAPERIARLSVLPGLAFWSFVAREDFVHYSTELPGIALLSLAAWAIAAALVLPPASRRRAALLLFLGGLCLGAVPFAKLQSAPQAAALAAAAAVLWFVVRRPDAAAFRRGLLWLVLGGATVPAVVLAFVLVFGLVGQFWYSFIVGNLAYAGLGQHPLREMPGWFFHVAATSSACAWFLSGCLAFALLYARSGGARPASARIGAAVSWILLGVAYLCTIQSGREVPHYLHLLVVPLITLCGFVLAGVDAEASSLPPGRLRQAPLIFFGLIALGPQVYDRAVSKPPYLGQLSAAESAAGSEAARFIRAHARPGDTLATWGWEPALYVDTGLPQATREAHTACELTVWPMQEFYRRRYVNDLLRRRATWFVDAVGPGAFIYKRRQSFGHEQTPEVNAIIDRDYQFLGEFGGMRIYRIRDDAGK